MDMKMQDFPTVCVVDDDASVCRALTKLLRSNQFRTEAFSRPADFLRRMTSPDDRCDVLLLDIDLGKMSGFDVHGRLTDSGLTIPTIFMTGNDDPEVRERVIRVGGRAYLVKPFQPDAVIAAVRMIVR